MNNVFMWFRKIICKIYGHDMSDVFTTHCSRCKEVVGEFKHELIETALSPAKLIMSSDVTKVREEIKFNTNQRIAKQNQEREKAILGYGLHGKFRPRSAYEKKLYDLSKKPSKEED